ncbi:MAG: DUF616 domain-containing protein [Prevotella sp.]|nr:DUF616 domain-containing protein [Prevotella sp.]
MKKYAIYSACIGEYDHILQPLVIHEEFDYIIYSDTIQEDKVGIWEIRRADFHHPDKTRIARWYKTHPELLVKDYEFSIWMDANIQIQTMAFYQRAIELYESHVMISSMWHHERDCIYDEAATVTFKNLDSERTILDWENKLHNEKYPPHHGLFESNVIYRIHNHPEIIRLEHLWWSCINDYSRRDQLSFNYALWKLNVECPFYLHTGKNTRNSDCVKWMPHHLSGNRHLEVTLSDNRIVTYYKGLYSDSKKLSHVYQKVSPFRCRHFLAFIVGQIFRFLIHIHRLKAIK